MNHQKYSKPITKRNVTTVSFENEAGKVSISLNEIAQVNVMALALRGLQAKILDEVFMKVGSRQAIASQPPVEILERMQHIFSKIRKELK